MVFNRVRSIIADQLGVNEDTITPQTDLVEDLGVDSLDIVEIALALEEEYGIEEMTEEDMAGIKTVDDLVNQLQNKLDA